MTHVPFGYVFFLAFIAGAALTEIDYCDPKLCPYQGKHVRCNNDGSFSKDCKGQYFLVDMTPYIPLILHEHNTYRNQIASGELQCYYPATRMPVLIWDWELSQNAEYNVKTCKFAHDQCRSTPTYPYVGQNIYSARTTRLNVTVAEFITEAIFLWYVEYLDCDYTVLEKFRRTIPQSGHFTLLVTDRQTKVGCAFLNNLETGNPKKRSVIFTCNYPSNNIRDFPSYKAGLPAADCSEYDDVYEDLCVDPIDPNDLDWYNEL